MQPARVVVTGAAGQIGYVISHSVAAGYLYDERPVILQLLEVPQAKDRLEALVMELQDSAYPQLAGIITATESGEIFKDADAAFLCASVPLLPGMNRADLLKANVPIFKRHGEDMGKYAKPTIKAIVIGNPVNTNAFIAMKSSKTLGPENFSALCTTDYFRSIVLSAEKLGVHHTKVHGVIQWGNHNDTMVPDLSKATYEDKNGEIKSVMEALGQDFCQNEFPEIIRKRGWDVVKLRGKSSALSPAQCSIMHIRYLLFGTEKPVCLAVPVPENSPYNLPTGCIASLPITVDKEGKYHVIENFEVNEWLQEKLRITCEDLIRERDLALKYLSELEQ